MLTKNQAIEKAEEALALASLNAGTGGAASIHLQVAAQWVHLAELKAKGL